ncbi:MAG: hypothetical protein IIU51_01175, partial [Bacteroidaceae bacterium]|nr:hypothetical protein [Bacteroidaceae bacterium]
EAEEVSEPLRMRHLLLRSNAQNKAYVDFTSDSIGCLLVNYYDAHGTPNERMLAHYIKGCAYRDMGDQPASLRCYNDAVAAADTSRADCNYDQLSIIYGQIADIFDRRAMPDNALQAYEYAEHYAWKAKDTIKVFTFWGNKSDALIDQGKTQEALRIKEEAANGFRNMGYPQKAARVLGLCIKWYARQGEFDKAKAAMDDYENHSGYFMENGDTKPGKEGYYSIKGTYFLEKDELDSAEHYFRKLLNNNSIKNQHLAVWGLSQLFKRLSISDSIAKYAYLGDILGDTLYSEQVAKSLQAAQSQYNYTRHLETAHRKELEAKDMEISRRNWIIAGVLLLSIIVFFWRKQIRLKKSELRTANRKNTQLSTQLHTANEENAQLNTQIDANNQEINTLNTQLDTANEENILLHTQIEKNSKLIFGLNEQLKKKDADIKTLALLKDGTEQLVRQLETEIRKRDAVKAKGKAEDTQIVKLFAQMAEERTGLPATDNWTELFKVMDNHFPSFTLQIKSCRSIGKNEYQVCVLTKLGFRVSDIAYLTNNSSNSITNLRSRMMVKLFGEEGGAKDFDAKIASL